MLVEQTMEKLVAMKLYGMADALRSWLEADLLTGDMPPRPPKRTPRVPDDGELLWVEVPARLAVKLELRWARHAAGLTQAELARRAGVTQQQIARLERHDSNPTLDTLEKVAAALGVRLRVSLEGRPGEPLSA